MVIAVIDGIVESQIVSNLKNYLHYTNYALGKILELV